MKLDSIYLPEQCISLDSIYSPEQCITFLEDMLNEHEFLLNATEEGVEYFDYAKLGWLLTQYPYVKISSDCTYLELGYHPKIVVEKY